MVSTPDPSTQVDYLLTVGQVAPVAVQALEAGDAWPDGTYTLVGGPGLTVAGTAVLDGDTLTLDWPTNVHADVLSQPYEVRIDGLRFINGQVKAAPGAASGTRTLDVTLNLGGPTIAATITVVGGGLDIRATYTIPMVARWNPTSLVPGIYPGRVFLFGCPVADITPAPPAPFQVLVDSAFADGTPSDPTVDDIPGDDAWSVVQDLEDADIYGALLVPVDYLVPPYEAYLPPQFEGSYPFDTPIWYRGSSIDADGFATVFHMFMPDGIPADPEAFPMIVFADGNRFEFTVAAPGSDTAEGAANDVTVDYEATGGTDAVPSARNVDARMAALEARLAALE